MRSYLPHLPKSPVNETVAATTTVRQVHAWVFVRCFIMSDTADNTEEDGPKYKLSSFLFGNVDKQGQIEEYTNDEDLKSINNIDQCHVKEVEETAQVVLSSEPSFVEDAQDQTSSINTIPSPVDYYDEQETVPDYVFESSFRELKPEESLLPSHAQAAEEDYDSPEAGPTKSSDEVKHEAGSTEPQGVVETLLDAPLVGPAEDVKTDAVPSVATSSQPDAMTSQNLDSGNFIQSSSSISLNTGAQNLATESDIGMMPPPLHPAPIAASRQSQGKASKGTAESPNHLGPSNADMLSDSASASPPPTTTGSEFSGLLNTPLGSLMPPEYASVDIMELFPAYDPTRTPRWGNIFRLPHTAGTYREFMERASYVNTLIEQRQARYADRPHLVYDGFLDLGMVPLPEEIIEHDEVVELNTSLPPGTDCLAGSEKSWWRRAYAAALAQMNGPSGKSSKSKTPVKADKQGRSNAGRESSTGQERSDADEKADESPSNASTLSPEDLRRGWRLGPAKYWYDQLGIPLDADISTWTEWRRPNLSSATSTLTTATAPSRPDDELVRSGETNGDSPTESTETKEGQDVTSFEAKSTEIPPNVEGGTTEQTEGPIPSSFTPVKGPVPLKHSYGDSSPTTVFPYQLLNWEDDIIYDPQLNTNKISACSKTNAAYAGWIPSQHCRTMAAFQDTYQGKFPFIVGSKAINGLNPATPVMEQLFGRDGTCKPHNPPYAIFPAENEGILSDSWVHDIIYDSDLPADQLPPPFLLTLNHNDEACLLESIDDVAIAAAINTVRGQRHRHSTSNKPNEQEAPGTATAASGLHSQADLHSDDQWEGGVRFGLDGDPSVPTTKSNAPLNRASLQVSFGLASTRGMLTGALAKAEHGAEKVKMILGKHGLLAEDDWQTDVDKFTSDVQNTSNAANDSTGDLGTDGNALASAAAAVSGIPPKDPLNLSNDEYYAIRSGALGGLGALARCGPLQHSTPAVELWPPFFPTYMGPLRLRQFHRVPLKRYLRGPMAQYNIPFPVTNLVRQIQRKAREREEEKAATGGGDIFFMRTPADLSGTDGDVVLCEFSEEYPPLMTQIGMASRIINYYRPLYPRDRALSPAPHASSDPPNLPYGSLVYVTGTDSPFLGVIRPGGCLQTLENNMYRAPIYPHTMPNTDFLLIRNRNGISIRRIKDIFTVGQEIPLMEVPGPNSKRANNFVRDFLQVFILRLFLHSTDEPKRIKIEEIRKAFPNHSESSVRKRLKVCADFRRTGSDASWWVLRNDYRLPSEEEVRYLVTPEDCCAHYSMLAAELRLKDAGYGEKSLFVFDENQEEEEDKEGQPKMEDEVRAAPWNTTRAYLASQRGGCFLELHGAADPTGCGEAFSYSKTSAKPGALFRQAGGEVARGLLKGKRTVTGTDADLRKLHLRDARALLRSFGISEADLKTFKRWEIIDMVRFASTERAKQGEEESSAKFARGNRLSMGEQVRCYREECQRIFDLQNRVLSNNELLSSDEEVSSEEEDEEAGDALGGRAGSSTSGATGGGASSIGGVRLSSLSASARAFSSVGRPSVTETDHREDSEREKLRRALESGEPILSSKRPRKTNPAGPRPKDTVGKLSSGLDPNETGDGAGGPAGNNTIYEASSAAAGTILDLPPPWPSATRKLLRIMRTYSEDGQQYTRTELVPWSPVVEIYLKIRQTRDDDFIHNFVDSDDQIKEQQRKEKRRLQDQLRRLRKQQAMMRERGAGGSSNAPLRTGGLAGSDPNRRRRHKPLTSALVKMRCGACGQTGHMRTNKECPMYGQSGASAADLSTTSRRGLDRRVGLKAPLRSLGSVARGASLDAAKLGRDLDSDPIAAAHALASRPVSELLAEQDDDQSSEKGVSGSRGDLNDTSAKIQAEKELDSSTGQAPGFGENDMTVEGTKLKLHSNLTRYIREQNRRNLKLKIRRQLLDRLNAAAAVVQSACANRRAMTNRAGVGRGRRASVGTNEDDFPTTIKHRGNRRRIDPRVALNHVFEGIYKGLTQIPGSKIFMHPVKEKDFPNYYSQIANPMDLSQIRMKINQNTYATREEFLSDIRLIYNNSLNFNGRYSSYTEIAMKMCSHVMEEFCHKELKLMRLESLVNPLLDEDDLVGLSFLLQQAIEAMRGVERSRPFHTPVDKRRFPSYYKIISNPMDLSTLEKMVKENRFRSRQEFFAQAELIYSNCVIFNGQESPLTEIAKAMLAAGRARLEQDVETLDTIEFNIRKHMESEPALSESHSIFRESADESSAAAPKSIQSSSRIPSVLSRKSTKRHTEDTTFPTEQHAAKLASLSTIKEDKDEDQAQPTASTSGGRNLRRRSSGTWYGVDLEYDDDDDADGDETDGSDGDAGPNRAAKRAKVEATDDDIRSQPWVTDDESMEASIERFTWAKASRVSQMPASHTSPGTDIHSPLLSPHTPDQGSSQAAPHRLTTTDYEEYEVDEEGVNSSEVEGDQSEPEEGDESGANVDSDESVDLQTWSRHEAEGAGDYSSAMAPDPMLDEDTRFSLGEPSRQTVELTDDLVAQDLQLTDSEDDSSLSGQGGELCTDEDQLALLSSGTAPTACDPSVPVIHYSTNLDPLYHRRSTSPQQQNHVHQVHDSPSVAFFIGEQAESE
ncbi:Transcription initiation factor TFIID subunit 1 [Clonorchis sinensis]|uniref:Transcription initiation factor TFIID subunit 1 n=1 Tax=Clonorchis sinensis TaxID=79923 RepID=A0A3R7G1C4_CLOSI|nr:Transcription initiation factor TFIID subunit 1 [Clonorchis sinensis]